MNQFADVENFLMENFFRIFFWLLSAKIFVDLDEPLHKNCKKCRKILKIKPQARAFRIYMGMGGGRGHPEEVTGPKLTKGPGKRPILGCKDPRIRVKHFS